MKTRIKVTRLITSENGEAIIDLNPDAEIIGVKSVQTTGGVTAIYIVEASPVLLVEVGDEADLPPVAAIA